MIALLADMLKKSKTDRVEQELREIKKTEDKLLKQEQRIEKKENKILNEEQKIEKVLFRIGSFEFKRKHLLELIKGVAGAFLGVGLGRSILNLDSLVEKLQWWNIIGILIFIIGISWLLIYKNERQYVQKHGMKVVWKDWEEIKMKPIYVNKDELPEGANLVGKVAAVSYNFSADVYKI